MSADDVPFAPVESYDAAPSQQQSGADVPFPLLLRYPGLGTTWMQTPDRRWVIVDDRTVRAEIAASWPSVPLMRQDAKGDWKPITPAQLQEQRGRRVDAIIYDLTTDRHVYMAHGDDLGGELYLSCARLDPAATPREDIDCAAWLKAFGGEHHEILIDWLATMHDLTRPTAALYMQGPPSAGKGLLSAACARLWGRQVTDYAKVVDRFNSSMRDCPVILLDEGARMDPNGSASFRSLVAQRSRAIEDKGRPVSTLIGCVRLMIAANNPDALRIREDLNGDDESAIGKRIAFIRIGPTAVGLLESMCSDEWVDTAGKAPGKLVRHIAWLQATRKVQTGKRFLVEGDAEAWVKGAARRGGLQQEALIAIARVASGGGGEFTEAERAVWFESGVALVSVDRLQKLWGRIMPGSTRAPTMNSLASAFSVVAPETSQRTFDYQRVRVRTVPMQPVLDAATVAGIGIEDDLRSVFGVG